MLDLINVFACVQQRFHVQTHHAHEHSKKQTVPLEFLVKFNKKSETLK